MRRIDDLARKRQVIDDALSAPGAAQESRPELPPNAVHALSQQVKALLDAWRLPDTDPVYFDERRYDFVIGQRRRGSQGKGWRALTHAAFTIGLMRTCRALDRPHPGFVVLDSPLVTFREPEGGSDRLGDEVKHAFYETLSTTDAREQITIIENEDPEPALADLIPITIFTKSQKGRYGFFPNSDQ